MLLDPLDVADSSADGRTIRLRGDMDLATVEAMLAPAYRAIAKGDRHLILDCTALTFCDSQGLNAMINLVEAVQPDGSVTLLEPSDMLVEVMHLTGLLDTFTISSTTR